MTEGRESLFPSMRRLLARATSLPWKADTNQGCKRIGGGKRTTSRQGQYHDVAFTVGISDEARDKANARLIAGAVNALPFLLDAVEYAREYLHGPVDPGEVCPCAVCESIRRLG